jgi:hypothetical protein
MDLLRKDWYDLSGVLFIAVVILFLVGCSPQTLIPTLSSTLTNDQLCVDPEPLAQPSVDPEPLAQPSVDPEPLAQPTPPASSTAYRITTSQLPDIASFGAQPSDQFILDADGMAMVSRTYPYLGSAMNCAHHGAHLHFRGTGVAYTVNIYAPADGIINMVTTCLNIGNSDRYGFNLEFARYGDDPLSFDFSIEPQDGYPCDADPDNYAPYIFVKKGDHVVKGQILGLMYKTALAADGAHIHFDILNDKTNAFYCPNIFTTAIEQDFASLFGSDVCGGVKFPATFCYQPGPGEDLTGRIGIP